MSETADYYATGQVSGLHGGLSFDDGGIPRVRRAALEYALRNSPMSTRPSDIVAAAKVYEAYLNGESHE